MQAPDWARARQWLDTNRKSVVSHLLFVAYVLSFASVVLTNQMRAPEKVFLWLVLPLFVAALFYPSTVAKLTGRYPIGWLFRSVILWAGLIYIVVMIVATIMSDGFRPAVMRPLRLDLRRGAELALFLSVTAYLTVFYPHFIKRFLLAAGMMLAVNAIVNFVLYLHTPFTTLSAFRLSASFGTPEYQNATHMAPLFAIYAMGGFSLLFAQILTRWQSWIVALCTSILMFAIVATQARGSLGAVLISLLVIAFAMPRGRRLWVAGIFILGVAIAIASPPVREALLLRGFSFRTELVAKFLELASIRPWWGYGLNTNFVVMIDDIAFEQPHNTLIAAQLRGGLIATAAAAVMLAGSLFYSFRLWQKSRNLAHFIVVLVVAIVSLTEIGFLIYPYNWIWITFWLPIGIGAGAEILVRQRQASLTDANGMSF